MNNPELKSDEEIVNLIEVSISKIESHADDASLSMQRIADAFERLAKAMEHFTSVLLFFKDLAEKEAKKNG